MDSGLPRYAPKSAIADLGTKMPISGKPEIGGPGMTSSTVRVIVKSGAPVGAPLAAPAER
jgi:hypothetical protein